MSTPITEAIDHLDASIKQTTEKIETATRSYSNDYLTTEAHVTQLSKLITERERLTGILSYDKAVTDIEELRKDSHRLERLIVQGDDRISHIERYIDGEPTTSPDGDDSAENQDL